MVTDEAAAQAIKFLFKLLDEKELGRFCDEVVKDEAVLIIGIMQDEILTDPEERLMRNRMAP